MAYVQWTKIASWKRFTIRTTAILAVAIVCGLSTAGWSEEQGGGKREIDVATVNMYVGADFSPVTTLNPSDPNYGVKLLTGVATIYGRIVASDFPRRAEALAQQIVAHAPDLVALQEVSLIRRQSPGDAIVGGTMPATKVELDYLAILLHALERRGGHYAVASQVQDIDVEVPLVTGPGTFDDLRLTDRDVILMRTDLPPGHLRTTNPQGANFVARVPLPIGVDVLRSWCSVDVQVRGRRFRFINAHLEQNLPPPLPDIQAIQAAELLGRSGPANTTLPVILAGDFNSDAYGKYGPAVYSLLTRQGGLTDSWSDARSGELGLTWGHDEFLSDRTLHFIYRLDLILFRAGSFEASDAVVVDPVIGSSAPLWFSDHAGVFATLAIK
jgi:endonuclease/exonuclease/phosphatase family metal-dependent hydrolase